MEAGIDGSGGILSHGSLDVRVCDCQHRQAEVTRDTLAERLTEEAISACVLLGMLGEVWALGPAERGRGMPVEVELEPRPTTIVTPIVTSARTDYLLSALHTSSTETAIDATRSVVRTVHQVPPIAIYCGRSAGDGDRRWLDEYETWQKQQLDHELGQMLDGDEPRAEEPPAPRRLRGRLLKLCEAGTRGPDMSLRTVRETLCYGRDAVEDEVLSGFWVMLVGEA